MSSDAKAHLNGAGYAAGPVTKPPAWHGLVAWDMLLNNLTTGLFLVAALGACTAQTVRWYAARHNWPLDCVDVDLTYKRDHMEGHSGLLDIFTKSVRIKGPQLTTEQRAKLVEVAGKCPIQRLMEGMPVIKTIEKV